MSRIHPAPFVLALLLGACTTGEAPPPRGAEVSIPFITGSQIRTFQPERDGSGVFIQNSRRDWFHVRFFTRCNELPFVAQIGFQTFGNTNTLSRGDTIIAGRERCRIASIVRSEPPPGRRQQQGGPEAEPQPQGS